MRGAGFRQPLPPLLLRIGRQPPLDRRVRRRRDPGLLKDPQAVKLARRLDDPGQYQVPETSSPLAAPSSPSTWYACSRASSRCAIREEVIGSGPPPAGPRLRPSSSCPAAIRCCAAAFSDSSSASSCADPRCSISRDPRREDHTTCTAVAPDDAFTVRIYGTRPLYEPRLVRKLSSRELQTSRSERRAPHESAIVSQLRSQTTAARGECLASGGGRAVLDKPWIAGSVRASNHGAATGTKWTHKK